jgi:hypothetical protein
MSQELTQKLVEMLIQVMATRDFEKISATFDSFLDADAKSVSEAAEQFLRRPSRKTDPMAVRRLAPGVD